MSGSDKETVAARPAVTVVLSLTSPTRSCHATISWGPGASPAIVKSPASPGTVKNEWSKTRMFALMWECRWQKALISPGLVNVRLLERPRG